MKPCEKMNLYMKFIAKWIGFLGRKGSQQSISQLIPVSAVMVDRGGRGRPNPFSSVPHTTGSVWVQSTAPDWLWIRTQFFCNLPMVCQDLHLLLSPPNILGPSLFPELRVEQKRNDKGLALTVSEREKQTFLRISMYTSGLSLAAHLFPLLVRLVEWTQLIKEWGYCLQGRRLPSLEIFGWTCWLEKERLVQCCQKRKVLADIYGIVLVFRPDQNIDSLPPELLSWGWRVGGALVNQKEQVKGSWISHGGVSWSGKRPGTPSGSWHPLTVWPRFLSPC